VGQIYLSAVEHGRNEVGAEVLLAISREFGKSLEWLLMGEEYVRLMGLSVRIFHDAWTSIRAKALFVSKLSRVREFHQRTKLTLLCRKRPLI
jgi:hypothetical protein